MHAFVRRISVAAFGALLVWVVPLQSATAGVDRWTTRGPSGANVTSVALSPSDPSTVYLGVDSPSVDFGSGVYKSSDGGQRWDLLDMGVLQDHITKVAVDPSSADIVYAGTHGSGVLKSTDGGSHWHRIWWQYNTEINALVVDPFDTQTIYAAADYPDEPPSSDLYRTTNGGVSWVIIDQSLPNSYVYALAIDPVAPNTIYAAPGNDGVYRSTDGGATWQPANGGIEGFTVYALAIDPNDPSTIWAGAEDYDDESQTGLYETTDDGQSWARVASPPFLDHIPMAMATDPSSPSTIYAATWKVGTFRPGGVFKTTDGGQTWAAASRGLWDLPVRELSIDPVSPQTLYAASGGGVFKTTDGAGTWTDASDGLLGTQVESMAVDPTDPALLYAGTTSWGVFRSATGGITWKPASGGLPPTKTVWILALDPVAPATLYAGTTGGGLYKTTDAGRSWSHLDNVFGGSFVLALAVDPLTEGVVYAGAGAVFKTTDAGVHWTQIFPLYPYIASVSALVTDPVTPGTAYVSLSGADTGVYKTVDGGHHWTLANQGLPSVPGSLAIDPVDPQILYAGMDCQGSGEVCVYKTTDGGGSWEPATEGFGRDDVSRIAVDPTDHLIVYAATYFDGIYRTTDGGDSWSPFDQGLKNRDVYAIVVNPLTGEAHAGTYAGVFDYEPG